MPAMTSTQRIFTALSHREPDRVPLVLGLTIQGARTLGMGIREYFQDPAQVVEAQLLMQARYGHDALCGVFHGALEAEAWGGEVAFREDGPPNTAGPVLAPGAPLSRLRPPEVGRCPGLGRVLRALEGMKARVRETIPILGAVISPFSLPVMQLGMERYMELLLEDREGFLGLMEKNIPFCQAWANAQLAAGATAVCYVDPMASPSMVPPPLYLETGFPVAQRTLAGILGPAAVSLASGRCLGVMDALIATGALAVGVGSEDDLVSVKERCRGRVGVIGNLNATEMIRWGAGDPAARVRAVLAQGASGGGFVLSDGHGEIPWGVTEESLLALGEAVREWGGYPLRGLEAHA